jgi:iron-sulfur cluster assembly protein
MALPKFKVITLTDAAAQRVKDIIAKAEGPIAGVRVGVKNGGCAGMSYTMEYAEAAVPGEDVVEDKGVKVFIDPKAVLFLFGTRWTFRPRSLPRNSSSTIRTRLQPAAAGNRWR